VSAVPVASVITLAFDGLDTIPRLPPVDQKRFEEAIVYWDAGTPALQLTNAQWAHVVAERKRIGRPLERAEVSAVVAEMEAADAGR
jgi:hypothetical protein